MPTWYEIRATKITKGLPFVNGAFTRTEEQVVLTLNADDGTWTDEPAPPVVTEVQRPHAPEEGGE